MTMDELATRLDKVYHNFDPYDYADTEGSVEEAKKILVEDPYTVINRLLEIIEEVI